MISFIPIIGIASIIFLPRHRLLSIKDLSYFPQKFFRIKRLEEKVYTFNNIALLFGHLPVISTHKKNFNIRPDLFHFVICVNAVLFRHHNICNKQMDIFVMFHISFKLNKTILAEIDKLLPPLRFNNRTEFIREAIRDKLNKIGLMIDFKEVKNNLKEVLDTFDHKLLNDIKPFDSENPSSENLSRIIYQAMKKKINSVSKVVVWESATAKAAYYEV